MAISIFYSYSHEDESYRQELEKWLRQLRDDGLVAEWHDRKILPGDSLEETIMENLDRSDVVIFLTSQDSLNSEACRAEMEYALQQGKRLVPIILRPCTWKDSPLSKVLVLPKDGRPISQWPCQEEAWNFVYESLKQLTRSLAATVRPRKDFLDAVRKTQFVRQGTGEVNLSDVFVFPRLVWTGEGDKQKRIRDVDELLSHEKDSILIEGDVLSGKTSLAVAIFEEALKKNFCPVLINGASVRRKSGFEKIVMEAYKQQFSGEYRLWLSMKDKVAIVDDFDHRVSPGFLAFLRGKFSKVIVFTSSDEYIVYFKDDEQFADSLVLSIRPLTLSRQEKLIRKWLALTQDPAEIDDRLVDDAEEKVNSAITKYQVIPRYPFYVLSVLQAVEAFMPQNYTITAFGHCYQALVTARLLMKNIRSEDLDDCFNFLTNLAYEMHEKGGKLTYSEYEDFKHRYAEEYIVLGSWLNRLENAEYAIIRFEEGTVRFQYPYLYFFFAAKKIAELEDSSLVARLCQSVANRESSLLLIFLVHHSRSKDLLDEILLHTMCALDVLPPAGLTREETSFMDELIRRLPRAILSGDPVERRRERVRDIADELSSSEGEEYDDTFLGELTKGLRIMEIVGQIAKNRAGSFEKNELEHILLEGEELGLRVMNYLLQGMRSGRWSEWLLAKVESDLPKGHMAEDYERERRRIQKIIQLFGFTLTILMILKIASSVGSDKLAQLLDKIAATKGTPSYELVALAVHIQYRSFDVDRIKSLWKKYKDEKNVWAAQCLSYIVQMYLDTHSVEYKDRQRVCSLLGINVKPRFRIPE